MLSTMKWANLVTYNVFISGSMMLWKRGQVFTFSDYGGAGANKGRNRWIASRRQGIAAGLVRSLCTQLLSALTSMPLTGGGLSSFSGSYSRVLKG